MASSPSPGRHRGCRAQSESIGVILLTAVVVLLVGGFGVVYLGALDDGGQGPLVDISVNATEERFSITHGDGESVPIGELAVDVRDDGTSERYAVDPTNVSGGADGTFDPGDRYWRDHELGGESMEVLLIHTTSNAVVHQAHLDAVDTGATMADFEYEPTDSAPGESVTFDASASSGIDGVRSYRWDWDGDGTVEETSTDPK